MPDVLMSCGDFSDFQEALKTLRRPDDIIINTINSGVPTNSFHPDEEKACKDLYNQLESGYQKREKLIKNCITVTADRVKKLKEQRDENSDSLDLNKELKSEQTKLRMLKVELSVEDLVKERTLKVYNERCRRFFKPL